MKPPLPGDIFKTGQVINNTYEIEGVLGRGGTGAVYRARSQISGRIVALKALNAEFSGNADYLELMKREEEMRDIIHDAVVRYSDNSRTADGQVFLVMDFVDGPSLNEWLHRDKVDPKDLLIVAHRVAEGLVATHARNIVHRDLSPDNIILRRGDPAQAVIIDFGIAKDSNDGARTIVGDDFAGKYEYAAPEQMDGNAEPRSDLYALGASLLAVYRGQIPNVGKTPGEVVRRKGKPLETEGVPEPLKSVIDWLTQPEIVNRPTSAAALVARLDEILKSKSRKTVLPKQVTKKEKRRFRWGMFLTPIIFAGVAFAVFYSGVWKQILQEPLPLAAPFVLEATNPATGQPSLSGNASDASQRSAIVAAFTQVTGQEPLEDSLTLAQGAPSPNWGQDVAEILLASEGLEDWRIQFSDMAIGAFGSTATPEAKVKIIEALETAAQSAGYSLSLSIDVPVQELPAAAIDDLLSKLQTCGKLEATPDDSLAFQPGEDIKVTGRVAENSDLAKIQAALSAIAGGRTIFTDVVSLSRPICVILAEVPTLDNDSLSLRFGNGDDTQPNLTGIYRVGDNPVIDLLVPATIDNGHIWALAIDVDGNLLNLLPNIGHTETLLTSNGTVEQGKRRIRIAYSNSERAADHKLTNINVDAQSFGKIMVIVFLSDKPLLPELRPSEESAQALAEALHSEFADGSVKIMSVVSRLMDLRK